MYKNNVSLSAPFSFAFEFSLNALSNADGLLRVVVVAAVVVTRSLFPLTRLLAFIDVLHFLEERMRIL